MLCKHLYASIRCTRFCERMCATVIMYMRIYVRMCACVCMYARVSVCVNVVYIYVHALICAYTCEVFSHYGKIRHIQIAYVICHRCEWITSPLSVY